MTIIKKVTFIGFLLTLCIPVFCQTADVTTGCAPLTVNFTAPSATNYWDFGNFTSANNDANPTAAYTTAGDYTVILYTSLGGAEIGRITINVYDKPSLDLTPDLPTGCTPLNIRFTPSVSMNSGISMTALDWVLGDGGTASGNTVLNHTYTNGGNYNVSLELTTNIPSCNVQKVFNSIVEAHEPPDISFETSPDPASSCNAPLTVSFTNTTTDIHPVTYFWDFGNGNTSTSAAPPDQNYTSDDTYTVRLTATNARNCSSTITKDVNIGSPSGVINVPDTLCLDAGVQFEYFNANSVEWGFGAGAQYYNTQSNRFETIANSDEKSIEVFFRIPGTRTITLETNNGGCVNTVTKNVFVQQLTINPVTNPVNSCVNPVMVQHSVTSDAVNPTYEWQFYDGSTSTDQTADVNYYDDGNVYGTIGVYNEFVDTTHIVPVIVTSQVTGCYDTAYTEFRHYPLNPKILLNDPNPSGCAPFTLSFMNATTDSPIDPITTSTWDFDDPGSTEPTKTLTGANALDDVTHVYNNAGTYNVTVSVESGSGCSAVSYPLEVTVGPDISALLDFSANNTTPCVGDEIELTPDFSMLPAGVIPDAWHFYTEGKRVFHQPDETPVKWTYLYESGLQDVTLEVDLNGCLSSVTKTNYIDLQGAAAEIFYERDCATPFQVSFESKSTSGNGILNLTWDFGDGNMSSNPIVTHTYAAEGTYLVTLTADDGGGCAASVDEAEILVVVPSAALSVDPIVCAGQELIMDGSASTGASCRGYTFRFPTFNARPITWDQDTYTVTLPETDPVNIGTGTPDRHELQLIVTDALGCKDTAKVEVQPFALAARGNANVTEACLPQEIDLTDLSISDATIASWTWGFSNGDTIRSTSTGTAKITLNAAPPDDRTFYGTLEITDINGCTSGANDTLVSIDFYSPRSRINVPKTGLCVPETVTFTADDDTRHGSNLEFDWDFGNGNNGNSDTEIVTYNTENDYRVKLLFTELSTGCYDSLFENISVQNYPVASFTTDVDALSVYCNPQTIVFNDNSTASSGVTTLNWDFDNGETSDLGNYTTTYTKGSYTVELTAETSNGCASNTSRVFDVVGPEGRIDVDDDTVCKGQEVTFELRDPVDVTSFEWFFGDGTQSDVSPVDQTYEFIPVSGQTVAQLILRSSDCTLTLDTLINFHIVEADFTRNDGIDTVTCIEDNSGFVFNDNSVNADSYYWDFGDNTTSTDQNPTHAYSALGTFTVTQVVENTSWGCKDTVAKQVVNTFPPSPLLTLSSDTLCLGETLNLAVQNPKFSSSYSWGPSTVFGSGMATSIVLRPNESFTVSLTETDENNCTSTTDSTIVVIPPFEFDNWETTIRLGESTNLPIEYDSLYDFTIDPPDGLSCFDCNFPEVTPSEDVTYSVTVSDKLNCNENTYEMTVFVIPPAFISMPDTFSPNGDGVNDVVYMGGQFIEELLEFNIYNRWGELVYHSTDPSQGWDGRYKGQMQNSEVYIYKIRALSEDGEMILKEGYLNLIK